MFCAFHGTAQPWHRNTFPGPGHFEHDYPPGQGWDLVEACQELEFSPIDADLKAFVDNEWTVVMTRDGLHFHPLRMAHTGTSDCKIQDLEFSRYNSSTIYALLTHTYWRSLTGTASPAGIWRSTDTGESWEHIYHLPEGAYERSGNYPFGTHLLEDPDPSRQDHLYFGTTSHGIVRTTDGGSTWESIVPALADRCIKMIQAGSTEESETYIYAIAEKIMPVHVPGENIPISNWAYTDYTERWKLDNNFSGTNGNGLEGEVSGFDASCAEGTHAVLFDGVSSRLSIEAHHYAGSYSTLTVAAWVRTGNGDRQVIASFDEDAYWQLGINGSSIDTGLITWTVYGSNGGRNELVSASRIDDGDWHHVAGVWDRGHMRIWIDGREEAYRSAVTTTFGSGVTRYGYLGVGSKSESYGDGLTGPDDFFEGALDDVRIYNNRGMNRDQVLGLYFEKNPKNPVAQGSLWRIRIAPDNSVSEVVRLHPGLEDFISVELNPADPSAGWVIRKGYPNLGQGGRELYRFSNHGERLSDASGLLGYSHAFGTIEINPYDTGHVALSCTGHLRSVFRYSLDGGNSWQAPDRDAGGYVPSIQSWQPMHYDYYFSGTGFPSDSWNHPRDKVIAFVPGSPGELLWINGMGGLMRSTDHGASFTGYGCGGPNKDLGQIAVAPSNPDRWATSSFEYGFPVTHNGGLFWKGVTYENTAVLASLTEESETTAEPWANNWTFSRTGSGIAFHPTNADRLIAAYTKLGYIIRSDDAGRTWTYTGERNMNQELTGVFWCRSDPDRVYAGSKRSMDGGDSWTELGKIVVAVSDANPDLLVGVQKCERDITAPDLGMHVSVDGGTTWAEMGNPPREKVPGTSSYWHVAATARTWGRLAMDMIAIDPSPGHDPAVDPGNRLRILMAGRSGIYEYNAINADGTGFEIDASNWTLRNTGIAPNRHYSAIEPVPWMGFVIFDPRPGYEHVVYAAKTMDNETLDDWSGEMNRNHTYPGGDNLEPFYMSTDGGITWEKLHGGNFPGAPESAMIHSLEVDSHGRLFAATCEGIYRISVSGYATSPPAVSYEVEFTIRASENGEAIPGCRLEFDGRELITDEHGMALADSLEYGLYALSAAAEGYEPAVFGGIDIFSDTGLVFSLGRSRYDLSVKVVDRGTGDPVYRSVISYNGLVEPTDQSGNAAIEDIEAGYWVFTIEHQDYFSLSDSILIRGDTSLVLQLTRKLASIGFLVSDPEGPLPGIRVWLNDYPITTDASGLALLPSRQPARADYSFRIEQEGYKPVLDTFFLEVDTILAITLEPATGTGEFPGGSASQHGLFRVYPNPASGTLYLDLPVTEAVVRLFGTDGRLLMVKKIYPGAGSDQIFGTSLDISGLPGGICCLQVQNEKMNRFKKLIIQKAL